jgi:hypothetical protein
MIAMPVAIPRRSGNHFTNVLTGAMYPSPHPIPQITPIPKNTNTGCNTVSPIPPINNPLPKNSADTVAVTLGPRRSTHGPPNAALKPKNTSAVE